MSTASPVIITGRQHYRHLLRASGENMPTERIFTLTRRQAEGIGRALLGAADEWARDHGLLHLTLHAGARNAGARAFYAALGFAEEEVRLTRPVCRAPV